MEAQVMGHENGHDHEAILRAVRHELPTDELLCDLSDLFKIF